MTALPDPKSPTEDPVGALARTGQLLRGAGQRARRAAIARRPANFEAARELRRKAEAEQRAASVAESKCQALEQAEAALQEQADALDQLRMQRIKHKAALVAMRAAARQDRKLRWHIFTLKLRLLSSLKVGAVALAVGVLAGLAASHLNLFAAPAPVADDSEPSFAYEDEVGIAPKLKLERAFAAH